MSLMMLSMVFVMVTMASASAKRVAEVLDDRKRPSRTPPTPSMTVPERFSVDFDRVSFKYSARAERNVAGGH